MFAVSQNLKVENFLIIFYFILTFANIAGQELIYIHGIFLFGRTERGKVSRLHDLRLFINLLVLSGDFFFLLVYFGGVSFAPFCSPVLKPNFNLTFRHSQ